MIYPPNSVDSFYRYSAKPLAYQAYYARPNSLYPAPYPYVVQSPDKRNGDSYDGNGQGGNSSFWYQHQGTSNSMEEACRHYVLDAAPDVLDHLPSVTQLGTMWLRDIQNHAMLKRDDLDAHPLPGPGVDAAKTLVGGALQGISRFFM